MDNIFSSKTTEVADTGESTDVVNTKITTKKVAEPDLEPVTLAGTAMSELAPSLTNHYTCLPIQRYQIGQFEFVHGYLSLSEEDGKNFESLIAKQPIQEQARLRKLPAAPQLLAAGVSMIQGIDHSNNAVQAPTPHPLA